jgi:hypothetical protein
MEEQEKVSTWATRDLTIPLILSGVISSVACIAVCVVLYLARNFLGSNVAPALGLVGPTPTPTLAPVLCPAIPSNWQQVMHDDFSANENYWQNGVDNNDYANATTRISEGKYKWDIKANQGVIYERGSIKNVTPEDFYVSVNVLNLGSAPDAEYGIEFRIKEHQTLFFAIQASGRVKVHVRDSKSDWQPLLFNGHTDNLRIFGPDQLEILRQDGRYSFCVNQELIGEVEDSVYAAGEFGLAAELENEGDKALLEFDDFVVYAP